MQDSTLGKRMFFVPTCFLARCKHVLLQHYICKVGVLIHHILHNLFVFILSCVICYKDIQYAQNLLSPCCAMIEELISIFWFLEIC